MRVGCGAAALAQPGPAQPLGTATTYQGLLRDGGTPATGLYDLQACLFDSAAGPTALVCATDANDVPVEDGLFTLALDFGAGLTGGPITGSGTVAIANGGVTTTMIAPGAVGSAQIANAAVGPGQIAANAVDSARIADGSVAAADIAVNAVGAAQPDSYPRAAVAGFGQFPCLPTVLRAKSTAPMQVALKRIWSTFLSAAASISKVMPVTALRSNRSLPCGGPALKAPTHSRTDTTGVRPMFPSTHLKPARRLLVASALLFASLPLVVSAQTSPPLGQAASFAVLGGSTVTNTGATNVVGNLGVAPGTAVTGFPPGIVSGGSIHINNAVAQQAQTDLTIAYNNLAGQAPTVDLTGQNLGGLTLGPGVYRFSTSAQLTGTLTLDAQGDPAAVFIFQIASTLTTASASSVVLINSGSDCNVYWQVGSSATLGTGSAIAGSILALSSITLTTGANLSGRALARNGAVTLDTNTVEVCAAGCAPISLAPTTLPNASLSQPYSQTLTATGGIAPYTYSVTAGTLPPGLNLSAAGLIAGTPTSAGTFSFTVTVTDAAGCTATRVYTIIVAPQGCPAITVLPVSLPAGGLGAPYSQAMSASGGTAPYLFSVTAGALPPGLALSPAGLLNGTPTTLGNFNFTITATDAASCPGSRPYAIAITFGGPGPGPTPIVRNVPTLSTWALALMALLTIAVVAGVGRRPG